MRFRTFFTLLTFILLTSCMTQANQESQANQILKQLNQAIQQQNWEQAEALFDPKFFNQTPRKYWEHQIELAIQEKGAIQSFNSVAYQKDPRFGGDFYIYVMSISHEHGTSHETVTIIQPIDDKPMMISGFLFK
ncbi:MAG: hypothetical protein Q9M18_08000 [Mariprofundaceae bacterium]|nr:hypothetical protein [Mariprofundaceae bacterium]